jgi:hypothetical protein
MSYLFPQGDSTQLGVLQVGSNINVDGNSVISLAQDVGTTANIVFNSITVNTLSVASETVTGNITAGNIITTGNVYSNGKQTITSVTPTANIGISLSNVVTGGAAASFQINNTGVLKVLAGTGIAISSNTGNVTISATGSTIINTTGQIANYTATASDDYIGGTGVTATTITLPAGVTGTSYIIKNEKLNSSKVTVACTGIDTIDGSSTKDLAQNASLSVVYRALVWRII